MLFVFNLNPRRINVTLPNVGNLLNRTLGLLKKNCQSTLVVDSAVAAEGTAFKDTVEKLVNLHKFFNITCHRFMP